jgi:endo-1,4-beta-xylanase
MNGFMLLWTVTLPLAAEELPPGMSLLPDRPLETMRFNGQRDFANFSRLDVASQVFHEAVRVEISKRPAHPYDVQVLFPTSQAIAQGDVLLLRFHARAAAAPPETGEAMLTAAFQQAGPPWTKSLQTTLSVGKDWQQFELPFRAAQSFDRGKAQLCFQFGYDPQIVEIGGVQLISYGKKMDLARLPRTRLRYEGQAAAAAWRVEAQQRIEKHRKADLVVTVLDADGKPAEGARVQVTMTRHAFGWGSAVTADLLTADTADARKYRETVAGLYNKVVFENDLKWPGWERTERRAMLLDAIRWLEEANIEIRGHCLVWPSWRHLPRDVARLADTPSALRQRVADHVTDEVSTLRGKLVEWDVINEPYSNHDLMDVLGKETMVDWFRLARQADADVRLFINDYAILAAGGRDTAHQDHYEQTIRYLLEQKAPLGGIGLQSHFGSDLTPPARLIQILDRFSQFGLPLEVTEHDINVADEQLQAEYTRDFLTAVFSHPSVNGILTWGFWEGRHWRPGAAYFRRDWSLTPAGQVWIDLVHKQWWTRESGATDAAGRCTVRGFLGQYDVKASQGDRSADAKCTLSADESRVTLRLP